MPLASSGPARRDTARLFALRLLRALTWPLVPAAPSVLPRRVVVIRPDHIGDALFTTPALAALRRALPAAEINALVGPWAADVYRRNPHLDNVFTLPFPAFGPAAKRHLLEPYQLLWAGAARLRRSGYQLALNLRFDFWWGALLAYTARIPRRVGYDLPALRPFLTDPVPYVPGRHEALQNLGLVATVAAPPAARDVWLADAAREGRLQFPVNAAERAAADALLAKWGPAGRRALVIHPGTRGQAKLWHAAGWAAVGDALVERLGAPVLVTGSGAEQDLCEAVATRMQRPATVVAGRTSLGELVALFARCRLVLGVDSGPLHLAVAAGVPTVHLYGPSDHIAFGPFGSPRRHAVVRSGLACSPCHSLARPAPDGGCDCLRAVTPDMVLAAAERVLASENAG
ncbi:MAG: glycosyltransferase family 9 protein [Chloroflexota bacterium]